jgi:hypothetical protein
MYAGLFCMKGWKSTPPAAKLDELASPADLVPQTGAGYGNFVAAHLLLILRSEWTRKECAQRQLYIKVGAIAENGRSNTPFGGPQV